MNFRQELSEKLIDFVRKHPCLYDMKDPEYKNVNYKAGLWEKIGREINENGDVAKVKWKSFRDNYGRYKKEAEANVQVKKFNRWPWSNQLQFLDGAITDRESLKAAQAEKNQSTTPPPQIYPETLLEAAEGTSRDATYSDRSSSTTPSPKRERSDSIEDQPQPKKSKTEDLKSPELDAVGHLFKSYAETFKSFTRRNQIALKLELAQLFADIEAKEIIENKKL